MKSHIFVDNIKCGGCASTIKKKVSEIDQISNVEVDIEKGSVSFDCENDKCRLKVLTILKKVGISSNGNRNKS